MAPVGFSWGKDATLVMSVTPKCSWEMPAPASTAAAGGRVPTHLRVGGALPEDEVAGYHDCSNNKRLCRWIILTSLHLVL